MVVRKQEDTGNWKRRHWLASYGELAVELS
jgi:hypothetical protein